MAANETIADIRKYAEAKFRELVEAYMQRRSTFQTTVGAMQAFNTLFDRIEVAYKRECGNSAALREALVNLDKWLFVGVDGYVHGRPDKTVEIERTIKDALAATATPSIQNTQED